VPPPEVPPGSGLNHYHVGILEGVAHKFFGRLVAQVIVPGDYMQEGHRNMASLLVAATVGPIGVRG